MLSGVCTIILLLSLLVPFSVRLFFLLASFIYLLFVWNVVCRCWHKIISKTIHCACTLPVFRFRFFLSLLLSFILSFISSKYRTNASERNIQTNVWNVRQKKNIKMFENSYNVVKNTCTHDELSCYLSLRIHIQIHSLQAYQRKTQNENKKKKYSKKAHRSKQINVLVRHSTIFFSFCIRFSFHILIHQCSRQWFQPMWCMSGYSCKYVQKFKRIITVIIIANESFTRHFVKNEKNEKTKIKYKIYSTRIIKNGIIHAK